MPAKDDLYHVVYRGKISPGFDPDAVRKKITRLLKLNPKKAGQVFSGKPMVIKKNASHSEARKLVDGFSKRGAVCELAKVKQVSQANPSPAPGGFNVTNGTFGVRIGIPEQWRVVEQSENDLTWELPDRTRVLIQFLAKKVIIQATTLDDFRQDLRLLGAQNNGGLVECEIIENFGICGVAKAAQETGGVMYSGHVLMPATDGHISIIVIAKEGGTTGLRETGVSLTTGYMDTDDDWFQDPYGVELEPKRSLVSRLFGKPPAPIAARSKSDDQEFDSQYPDHPLSRVRKVLAEIKTNTQGITPSEEHGNVRIDTEFGFSLWLPLSFEAFDEGKMGAGQVYRRTTFDGLMSMVSVCRQPDFPDCGENISETKELVQKHSEWSESCFIQKPVFKKRTIEGVEGIYCERELVQKGRNILCRSFFTPWFENSLEITVMTELMDGPRAQQWLAFAVRSLESTESAD